MLIIIQILLFSCKTMNQNNKKMEKINIKEFRIQKFQLNETYKDEVKDTIIEYGVRDDHFIKNTMVKGSPYYTKKTYYRSNLQLKASTSYFYSIPIGISEKYDEKGDLIEKVDWGESKKINFSIEKLIRKMKEEFEIDLLVPKNIGVAFGKMDAHDKTQLDSKNNVLAYMVTIHLENHQGIRVIKIDAQTGETISDDILQYEY